MNTNEKVLVTVIGLSLCVLISGPANAHTTWINAVDYTMQTVPGHGPSGDEENADQHIAQTNVYFGFGHRYPVDDFMPKEMLSTFCLSDGNQNKKALEPNPGGFLATVVKFDRPGPYTVAAAVKPGYYTMHFEKGRIQHKLGPKTGLKAVILSLYYEQYAKALLAVGDTRDDAFAKPLGDKIEIVPLKNPLNMKAGAGRILPVQVWFDGRPASFCKVYATYAGFSTKDDFALATMADSKGVAYVRLMHWGPWLVKAQKRMPANGPFRDKCDELSYTATLTFEIQ